MAERANEPRVLGPAARFIFQGDSAARKTAGDAFGVPLPETACRANTVDDRAALWLGPGEHLLFGPAENTQDFLASLEAALSGFAHSLVDVSQRQVAVQMDGPDTSALLNSGCPLDLDPAAFPVGMCTRTLIAKAEVVLWRRGIEEYHLEVGRSFSDYVLGWLREANRGG
jgi:sarcosine oxidase, subunit gamma